MKPNAYPTRGQKGSPDGVGSRFANRSDITARATNAVTANPRWISPITTWCAVAGLGVVGKNETQMAQSPARSVISRSGQSYPS